jgi:A/G-specific adenine glycosylase
MAENNDIVQNYLPNWLLKVKRKREKIQIPLLEWYAEHARVLPWRRKRHPYSTWVSEIMLQQTRVDTVLDYFKRFMKRFPSIRKLAQASEDEVFKMWEGLGYYNRARNLHTGAQKIVYELGGRYPKTVEEWQKIPGVGRYTAGAIVSIVYGKAVPILDTNVKRVLARLFLIQENVDSHSVVHHLWQAAETLVPETDPSSFNQAMMELGARVCIPRNPKCDVCPVYHSCDARKRDMQNELPVRARKKPVPHRHVVAAAIRKKGSYLLGKTPEREDAQWIMGVSRRQGGRGGNPRGCPDAGDRGGDGSADSDCKAPDFRRSFLYPSEGHDPFVSV